jgi:hypothetical protein
LRGTGQNRQLANHPIDVVTADRAASDVGREDFHLLNPTEKVSLIVDKPQVRIDGDYHVKVSWLIAPLPRWLGIVPEVLNDDDFIFAGFPDFHQDFRGFHRFA